MAVDWSSLVLSILKAFNTKDLEISPKYIAVKPRALSDQRLLRGAAILRSILAFVPAGSVAASVLSLGDMGFRIWKYLALRGDYDSLLFPPLDPNIVLLSIREDPELSKHYGHLTGVQNRDPETIAELEKIYTDFRFITNPELLQAKYPHVSPEYIQAVTSRNRHILNTTLEQLESEIRKISYPPEIEANLEEAIAALKELFPAMRDWALFNSEGFNEVVQLLDVIV